MIFAGVMLLFKATIPETFAPVILKRRAAKLRKQTGDLNIVTEQEIYKVSFADMLQDTLVRPFAMLITEPILLLLSLYIALIYGLLVRLLTTVSISICSQVCSTHSSSATPLSSATTTIGTTASSALRLSPSG